MGGFVRNILFFALALMGMNAAAAIGEITCVARQFEITRNGLKDEEEKPLLVDKKVGSTIVMTVDIGERAFVLNGDTFTGDFLLTQAWGQDYTSGINTTGSFNSSGRMTISQVIVNKVFKLECSKTLASDFPRE